MTVVIIIIINIVDKECKLSIQQPAWHLASPEERLYLKKFSQILHAFSTAQP